MANDTLNIYEVLDSLNKKINNNTSQIEDNTKQLKIQLDEIKIYLLEKIEHKAKESLDFLNSELKKEAFENRKHINSKHERLVTDEFKKLKTDINNDLENLANKVMNSRIL
jgi:F0F1-type ATP synthase membrane subunit b/b'